MERLSSFFAAIEHDPRIGTSHISLYCALLDAFECGHLADGSIFLVSKQMMKKAKIFGLATYHGCLKDLHDFDYIIYKPSYNHRKKSKVFIKLT